MSSRCATSAYGGNGSCQYRLHVGTFPGRWPWCRPAASRGTEVEVRFLGDVAGEFTQKIKLPSAPDPHFAVFAQDANGISPSGIPFRLSDLPDVIESGANNSHATATPVPQVPAALNGVIAKPGEVDHYRFHAKKGQTFDVHCYARRLGSPLDSVMYVSVLNGGALVGNDDAVGPDSYFRFTAPEDKDYVLSLHDHLKKGGPTYFYRVELTPVEPAATVTIPRMVQFSQERQALAVPKGNRMAALVTVARRDFGGEVVLGATNLPAGVTMQAETMPANLDTLPVVFEAAPSAAGSGALSDLTATHVDPKQKIHSTFSQIAELIYGMNQVVMWKTEMHREALAVAEEVPFSIRIVEPKAPLVQGGSMNLKIVAERKAGFKAAITVIPIWNPPGVGTGATTIPRTERGTPADERGWQRPVPQMEDGRAGHRGRWQRPGLGVVAAGDVRGVAAVLCLSDGAGLVRAGQEYGDLLQDPAADALRGPGEGERPRPAAEGDDVRNADDEGREGTGLQADRG